MTKRCGRVVTKRLQFVSGCLSCDLDLFKFISRYSMMNDLLQNLHLNNGHHLNSILRNAVVNKRLTILDTSFQ